MTTSTYRCPSGATGRPSRIGTQGQTTATLKVRAGRVSFEDYRIRVADVFRDYDMATAPQT